MRGRRRSPAMTLAVDRGDPRLARPIDQVGLSPAAAAACARLHVATLADFLDASRADFLALPGFGAEVLRELTAAVQKVLSAPTPAAGGGEQASDDDFRRPLLELMSNRRAARTLARLSIQTLDDLLSASRVQLLTIPGFDHHTYCWLIERVRAIAAAKPPDAALLPRRLLRFPVDRLAVGGTMRRALRQLGYRTVGDLMAQPSDLLAQIGAEGHARVHDALDALIQFGSDQGASAAGPRSFAELIARLMSVLELDAQDLLRRRVGLGAPPQTAFELAQAKGVAVKDMEAALRNVRCVLAARAADLAQLLRREAEKELEAWDGFVTPDRLAAGGILHRAARESGDPALPLRLLSFCFPDELHLCGNALTRAPAAAVRRARQVLRQLTRPVLLPVGLTSLSQTLAARGLRIDRGLLLHLLSRRRRLAVFMHPEHGEVVTRTPDAVADRLHALLAAAPAAIPLADLAAEYASRHGSCRRRRLLARLRSDSRFVEVGSQLWAAADNYREQLQSYAAQAERIAARIHRAGRHSVRDVAEESPPSERTLYLLTALLRRDPSLRDLGRGGFCSRHAKTSSVLARLELAMRRAMGEVPLGRFVDNQPPADQHLVARLLHHNRLFVYPHDNRVDLLSNYPLSRRRIAELLRIATALLQERDGYATLRQVRAAVQRSALAGEFMTALLVRDLLRRHGRFEFLPGGLVALAERQLSAQIRASARAALAAAARPLTVSDLVAADPALEPFARCLAPLLLDDPAVSCEGDAYRIAPDRPPDGG